MTTEAMKRILIITAHPDDADVHGGGTIAHWVDDGHEVHAVIATSGDKGHNDTSTKRDDVIALRQSEQRRAADILGVQRLTFLNYEDGELAWAGPKLHAELTALVRLERPDLVLTHDPYAGAPRYATYQLHPDHRAVGFAVIDVVYFRAPGPLYYPDHIAGRLEPHRVSELLLIMGDHPDHCVDIGATFRRKLEAVRAHTSQWGKHPDLEGFLRGRAQRVGEPHGMALAEGFKTPELRFARRLPLIRPSSRRASHS